MNIIEVDHLKLTLGGTNIQKDLSLSVHQGEILGVVGGSGSGKTTLLREMLLLQKPDAGSIRIFDCELTRASLATKLAVQRRIGVLFQQNALFSSLNVLDNTAFPLREHTELDFGTIKELALLKILMVGLSADVAVKYPAELSGGMQKRAALARAIVLDPELIFLDEPTAGLDPNSAAGLDELILNLQETMNLTIVVITHDLDTLWRITNRVAFIGEGKILCVDTMKALSTHPHPQIKEFFGGERGRTVKGIYGNES